MLVSVDLIRSELAGTPIHLTIVARATTSQEPGWPVVASLALQCITGFRLPTGGSHLTPSDVRTRARYWNPLWNPGLRIGEGQGGSTA